VHRDVSPQNMLLSFDGAVKIADFGIASANLFREEPGVLKGKTAYMSPEQARGERVTRRTDIYSLGVVFHELLTGRALHGSAEGQELLEAVRAGRVEPPSTFVRELPADLEEIVMKLLARDPTERFQTAREVASAISVVLLTRQQLIDSHVLESVLAELVPREHTSPGLPLPEPIPGLHIGPDASEHASSFSLAGPGSVGSDAQPDEATGPGLTQGGLRERAGREDRRRPGRRPPEERAAGRRGIVLALELEVPVEVQPDPERAGGDPEHADRLQRAHGGARRTEERRERRDEAEDEQHACGLDDVLCVHRAIIDPQRRRP